MTNAWTSTNLKPIEAYDFQTSLSPFQMRNHYDCTCFKVKSDFSENVGEAVKPFKASRISDMNSHNEVVLFDVFLFLFFLFLFFSFFCERMLAVVLMAGYMTCFGSAYAVSNYIPSSGPPVTYLLQIACLSTLLQYQ